MEDVKYQFAVPKCGRCGSSLSGKRAELEGMKDHIPMGYCPKCGSAHRLVEFQAEAKPVKASKSKPKPTPKPEAKKAAPEE